MQPCIDPHYHVHLKTENIQHKAAMPGKGEAGE